jgi:hypothetical protein
VHHAPSRRATCGRATCGRGSAANSHVSARAAPQMDGAEQGERSDPEEERRRRPRSGAHRPGPASPAAARVPPAVPGTDLHGAEIGDRDGPLGLRYVAGPRGEHGPPRGLGGGRPDPRCTCRNPCRTGAGRSRGAGRRARRCSGGRSAPTPWLPAARRAASRRRPPMSTGFEWGVSCRPPVVVRQCVPVGARAPRGVRLRAPAVARRAPYREEDDGGRSCHSRVSIRHMRTAAAPAATAR